MQVDAEDFGAVGGEGDANGGAQARGGASDDGDAVLESAWRWLWWCRLGRHCHQSVGESELGYFRYLMLYQVGRRFMKSGE